MGLPRTTTGLADYFRVPVWQIRRCLEQGLIPQSKRLGIYRVVEDEDLPAVEAVLIKKGYLLPEGARSKVQEPAMAV
jgi:hypothetical protein